MNTSNAKLYTNLDSRMRRMTSQSYTSQTQAKSVKQSFLSLADAMLYLNRSRELERKVEETKDLLDKRLISLEALKVDISDDITKLEGLVGEQRTNDLSKQITSFSTAAIDQLKQKLSQEAKSQLAIFSSDSDSEKTKTVKCIEAFLSTTPLELIDRSIIVELQDATYASRARYRCQNSVEYEFSLDTKLSPFFKGKFKPGSLDRTLKVPVGLGKSWLKKDPVPDFRNFEQYFLTSAEATETSLMADCASEDGDEHLKLVYTRHGARVSLSVTFSSGEKSVDVTSEPGLNAHLDSDKFIRLMERIWLAVNELERRKIALTKLVSDNRSILENLDCADFFLKSWQAISKPIKDIVKSSNGSKAMDDELLDSKTIKEKLKILGPEAIQVADMLGVEMV